MKTLILLLLIPVLSWAQHKHTMGGPCGAELFYGDDPAVLYGKCEKCSQKYAVMERESGVNNAAQATNSVFSLWQGLHAGAEFQNNVTSPHNASFNAFGQVRFMLAKDLTAGLKVSLPMGMSGVRYEVNLSKRVF